MMSKLPVLRVIDIVSGTSVDGPGLRTSVYLAGCNHQCEGCHNPDTWPFDAGYDMEGDELVEIITHEGLNVTFSGGDPIYQAEHLVPIVNELKRRGFNIWCYTGFTLSQLAASGSQAINELLNRLDVLVDGPFVERLRDNSLCFRGSKNQNIIDLKTRTIVSPKYDSYNEFQV